MSLKTFDAGSPGAVRTAMQRCQADSTHAAGNQEHALRNSEARLQALFDSTPDALVISDAEGRITMANQQVETLLGYTVSELLGLSIDFLIPENARASHAVQRIAFAGNSAARRMGQGLEVRARRKDGSECDVEISLSRVRTEEGQLFASALRDISQRKYADEQLRIAAVAFEAREGMVVTDEKFHILRTNRAFTELTGYSAEEVLGKTSHILRSERYSGGAFQLMHDCIQRNGSWQGESWDRRKTGEVYPIWLRISAVKNKDGMVTHYIGTGHDITERKRAEEKINELAFFDQLTGLPNRTLLLDRLQQVVAGNMRNKRFSSLLFIDLDHFKTLNDTLGHNMGDQLLKQVAHRLKLCVREGDTVARFGGDEFVVVLKDVGANALEAASGTEVVGEKILAALDQTYELSDISHRSTASIGATVFNGQAPAIDDWMKQADLAMYRSKSAGRNTFRFFDPSMETVVKERAAMEDDLERALLLKQFALHYQAQIEGDGSVTGAEVLLRWVHPVRGLVPPGEFIPLAEETGHILKIGDWVLRTACCQLALWAECDSMQHLSIAVNVSAHQFRQANFVEQVIQIIADTGANPRRLKLELTESLLIDNVQDIVTKMVALKTRGLGFSLDDFGTGYSSLSYLKRLPLDQLKIDQSFVHDVLTDPNDASIAKTIVALAASLGLSVIAEGVETSAQRDFLAAAGCQAYQGYLFSKPVAVSTFEAYAAAAIDRWKAIPISDYESSLC